MEGGLLYILSLDFDRMIICAVADAAIKEQLIGQMGVDAAKIKSVKEIDEYYMLKVIEKYRDCPNEEKHPYVLESDPQWVECLERTFSPYKDKVVICEKALSRYDSADTIALDSLLEGQKIDFLKMDIEGPEVDALLGAKKTLLNSHASCSVCCYHRMNDEENIRFILEGLGYKTSVSEGYMFFWYDENIYDTLDLRKGIVYADK